MTKDIRIAIAGVGNCASSLIQGIEYYRRHKKSGNNDYMGLLSWDVLGYTPKDIKVVAAFDIDKRKVGQPLHKAISAK